MRLPGGGIDLSLDVKVKESGWFGTRTKAEGGASSACVSSAAKPAAGEPAAAEPPASDPPGVNIFATDSHLRAEVVSAWREQLPKGGATHHSNAERVKRS
jgi:hypothetical protein